MEEIIIIIIIMAREMGLEEIATIVAVVVGTEIIVIRIPIIMTTMGCICNVWNVCVTNLFVFYLHYFCSLKWSIWLVYKFYVIEILYLLQIGSIG